MGCSSMLPVWTSRSRPGRSPAPPSARGTNRTEPTYFARFAKGTNGTRQHPRGAAAVPRLWRHESHPALLH
ncbi:MAG TPA: hypothetical protein EYQ27_12185 [Gemmatimonadetes bacterium]|nr:hypothetical protein [Gemmatimonadota bacterium]